MTPAKFREFRETGLRADHMIDKIDTFSWYRARKACTISIVFLQDFLLNFTIGHS